MSAFLGPIHFWMYDKIQVQEEIIRRLAAAAEKNGWLTAEETAAYINTETRPLEELIDESNIHGWLSARIEQVETRYATLATKLLAQHEDRLDTMEDILFQFGAEKNTGTNLTAQECYKLIDSCTLDGMPCDGVNIVTDKHEDSFTWERRSDVHSMYWTKAGGKPEYYDSLRNRFVAGLLSNTSFSLVTEAGRYKLLA